MANNNPIPVKERMKIPRVVMPEQEPLIRARNFKEVNLGLESAAVADDKLGELEAR